MRDVSELLKPAPTCISCGRELTRTEDVRRGVCTDCNRPNPLPPAGVWFKTTDVRNADVGNTQEVEFAFSEVRSCGAPIIYAPGTKPVNLGEPTAWVTFKGTNDCVIFPAKDWERFKQEFDAWRSRT
jgi:hypothetical protein